MVNNLAFYSKYRPQTLSQLVGQEAVKKSLLSGFQSNKLSHAYIFVGPRGTGKTSTARILAKMVNCETLATSDLPCNKCATCISITDGSNLDLIEIDAASNRGIEDMRSLRERIKFSPSAARKKVYIIDEVHMLTTEAFNALLKTLEEPPAHVLFILATTEATKIPQTILSRVQRLDFKLAKPGELVEALTKIVQQEKIDIEEEALRLLVRQAGGSFRDGVKLLDQVSSLGGKITALSLEESLKWNQLDGLLDLLKSLVKKNSKESLLKILKLGENGADTKELILSVMEILRNLLFIKNGLGESLIMPQFTEDKYGQLLSLSEGFSSKDLIRDLNILQEALEKLKFASILSLPLELAVVEICREQSSVVSMQEKLVVGSVKLDEEIRSSKVEDLSKSQTSNFQPQDPISNLQHLTSNNDIQKLKEKWTFVLETVRQVNFSLEALLRSINIKECSDSSVVMEVPYSFHQRILEAPKNRDLLEGVFSDILGRSVRISVVLGNRPRRKEDIANIELAQDDEIIRAAAEIFNSDGVN